MGHEIAFQANMHTAVQSGKLNGKKDGTYPQGKQPGQPEKQQQAPCQAEKEEKGGGGEASRKPAAASRAMLSQSFSI